MQKGNVTCCFSLPPISAPDRLLHTVTASLGSRSPLVAFWSQHITVPLSTQLPNSEKIYCHFWAFFYELMFRIPSRHPHRPRRHAAQLPQSLFPSEPIGHESFFCTGGLTAIKIAGLSLQKISASAQSGGAVAGSGNYRTIAYISSTVLPFRPIFSAVRPSLV